MLVADTDRWVGMETSIARTLTDDTALVTVRGEIDFSNSDELARCVVAAITEWSPTVVQVELGDATFIDSTGLGALIEGYRATTETGAGFVVTNPTPGFRRVLTVTGLGDFFGVPEPADEAAPAQATGT